MSALPASASSSSAAADVGWTPFVSRSATSGLAVANCDWSKVKPNADEIASDVVLQVVDKHGGVSSAFHYGGSWMVSTSHAFPTVEVLIGAKFFRRGQLVGEVTLSTTFFLVHASSSRLFPDLLFIRLHMGDIELSGTSVNHAKFKGIGSGADAEVSVFSFGYNAKGEHHLHHSTGSLTKPPSGLQTHSDMFWHDAPTRPGSSGGLVVSRGKVIGMCLGGALKDGSKNIALHFQPPRTHTGFPGIAGYATALIEHIAKLDRTESIQKIWRQKMDFENKLMADEGRQPLAGSSTADELLPQVNAACHEIRNGLMDLCCKNNIPGLLVHSGTDILFDVRTQELTGEDEASSSDESEAALSEWYTLAASDSELKKKWQHVYKHFVLTVSQINRLLVDAVNNKVYAAAEIKEMVDVHDSRIQSGVHYMGIGGGRYGPDKEPHFGIHVDKGTSNQTYHCQLQRDAAGAGWAIPLVIKKYTPNPKLLFGLKCSQAATCPQCSKLS